VTEELLRRALASAPAIRRGLEALEGAARSGGPDALARAAGLLREAAAAAEDAADALELLAEYAKASPGKRSGGDRRRRAGQSGKRPGLKWVQATLRRRVAYKRRSVLELLWATCS